MKRISILVIEDEPDIRDLILYSLEKEGYTAIGAASGEQGLICCRETKPDLVLLDVMLPGIDGFEVLRRLRSDINGERIPVLMLTAKGEDIDIVKGFEADADDYIAKPFSPRVLMARIKARLRRTPSWGKKGSSQAALHQSSLSDSASLRPNQAAIKPHPAYSAHGLKLDIARHELNGPRGKIDLSPTEFCLMEFFMANPGWVFSRTQLIQAVKGDDYPVTDRAVDVQILGLRKKLGELGQLIETIRGVGYRFRDLNT